MYIQRHGVNACEQLAIALEQAESASNICKWNYWEKGLGYNRLYNLAHASSIMKNGLQSLRMIQKIMFQTLMQMKTTVL